MRKLLAFIIVIFLILVGCTKPTPLLFPVLSSGGESVQTNVYIDYRFSEPEETSITNALKSWECSLNYKIRFKIHYDTHYEYFEAADKKDLFIWKVDSKNEHIIEADKKLEQGDDRTDRFVVGLFLIGTKHPSVILLRMDRIGTDDIWTISIHEIGHFLGLGHSDDKNSVMYRFTDIGSNKITELDIKNVCSIYRFNYSDMKVCNIK